jgi:hypothetical protein
MEMKLTLQNQQIAPGSAIRTVTHQGTPHWVIPVIMMVEGVHSGSGGALLYTSEELGKFTTAWDGTPVTIDHPVDNEGEAASANSPELDSQIVGRLYNTHMDGDKLKSEAWIDIQRLQEVSLETYTMLKENNALDVSVGVFAEEINISGEFNNEEYRAIAQHLRPDHLALLPNAVGACSWDDGCGVRTNEKNKHEDVKKIDLKQLSRQDLLKEGFGTHFISNETGFREIMHNVQQKLDQLDNDIRIHFLEDLFDDNFVYRVHNRETGETSFFQRNYSVQEDGSVDFTTDPIQVRKDVSFVELEESSKPRQRTKFNNKTDKDMKTNASPCKVDALIENKATAYTEKDKEWLSTFSDDQLDKMIPVKEEIVENNDPPKTEKKEEKAEPAVINKAEIKENVKAVFDDMESPEDFIDLLPEGMQGQMRSGLKMHQEKRAQLVKGIVDNSNFEETNLTKWSDEDLQKLHDSVIPVVNDYSALGGGGNSPTNNADDVEEVASMLGPQAEKTDKK